MSQRPPTPELYIVVDGGGTKTDCQVLSRSGSGFHVLGQGRATGSNPNAIGAENAASSIVEAIDTARSSAGLSREDSIRRAAIAVAGTADESRRAELEALLQARDIARECRVFPDVIPILTAAATTGPAAALISGTGATAISRNASGEHVLAGGWGYLLGDEGSGYSVGREALRHTLLELETGAKLSQLSLQVAEKLGTKTIAGIKQVVYACDNQRQVVASMAPVVLDCMAGGDDRAKSIADETVQHLASILDRANERLSLVNQEVPVAVTGGLFKPGSPLREPLEQALRDARSYATVRFVAEPLECVHHLLDEQVFVQDIRFLQ